jgi:hypothetical protein
MKRILLLVLLVSTFCYSQKKVEYYKYGYEGIEMLGKVGDTTVIYTQHKAKGTIRIDVANKVVNLYLSKKLKDGTLVVELPIAIVTGRIKMERKDKLVVINYFYERVEWCDQELIEIPLVIKDEKSKHKVRASNSR